MRLIDADALWDEIYDYRRKGELEDWQADLILECISDAPSAEAFVGKWISVRDAMPIRGDTVLAIVSGNPRADIELVGECKLAAYCDGYWHVKGYPEWCHAEVPYWLPIPENSPQISIVVPESGTERKTYVY